MSYHEIEMRQCWRVNCADCFFIRETYSAGEAERVATEHIEEITEGDGLANFSHIVQITQVTLVGRQP